MSDSATPRSLARRAPLSVEFPRQVYWSGLPCPPPGDLPNPGIEPGLQHCRQILYCLSHQGSPEDLLGTTKTSDTSGTPYSLTRGCFASFPSKETQTLPCQVKVTACSACCCSTLRTPRRRTPAWPRQCDASFSVCTLCHRQSLLVFSPSRWRALSLG